MYIIFALCMTKKSQIVTSLKYDLFLSYACINFAFHSMKQYSFLVLLCIILNKYVIVGQNIYYVFVGTFPIWQESHWEINSCHDKVRLNSHNLRHASFSFLTFTCELPVMLSTWLVTTDNARNFLAFFSLNVSVRRLWNCGLRYWGCSWAMI